MSHRDISEAHFRRAATREGFKIELFWLFDTTAENRTGYGMVLHPKTRRVLRAASLRKAIKSRDEDRAARPKS